MNWFLRLKLAHKLLLTFMACSALTAAVGVYGLLRIVELGGMLDRVYRDNVVAAQYVSDASGRFGAHSRAYVRLPAMHDPEMIKSTVTRAQSHMDKLQKALAAYRATNLMPHEVELLKGLDEQLPAYVAQNEKVAALAAAGKAGRRPAVASLAAVDADEVDEGHFARF